MLTIKHVEKDGCQGLIMAHGVQFHPADKNSPTRVDAFGCTGIGGAVDEHGNCTYQSGKVYVMNDAGSTVGAYDLD